MIRSFVAVELPDSMREMLDEVGQGLQRQVPHRSVRWTRISSIHLTLKFLGNVAEADIPQIKTLLAKVGQQLTPFSFTVGGIGCFPSVQRPRVIWVGVQEGTGALATLQRDVEKCLTGLGFERETRPFHPHLTLGRTRRDVPSSDRRKLAEVIAGTDVGELGEIRVESFRLMRSDLRPTGAVYTPLAVFALATDQKER